MKWLPSRAEAADELREQASSCRKLALTSATSRASTALRAVADQFDSDAARVDPALAPTAIADAAALVRVRVALEWQMRVRFGSATRGSR